MKSMESTIKDIIEHGIGKVPWCILGTKEKNFQFSCLYSSLKEFKTGNTYSLYEIEPLERFLAKKNKLLDKQVLEKIYKEDKQRTLSYIVNWDQDGKLVLLLQIKNPFTKPEQVKETLEIIAKNRNQICDRFIHDNDKREEHHLDG